MPPHRKIQTPFDAHCLDACTVPAVFVSTRRGSGDTLVAMKNLANLNRFTSFALGAAVTSLVFVMLATAKEPAPTLTAEEVEWVKEAKDAISILPVNNPEDRLVRHRVGIMGTLATTGDLASLGSITGSRFGLRDDNAKSAGGYVESTDGLLSVSYHSDKMTLAVSSFVLKNDTRSPHFRYMVASEKGSDDESGFTMSLSDSGYPMLSVRRGDLSTDLAVNEDTSFVTWRYGDMLASKSLVRKSEANFINKISDSEEKDND